jgi:DNA-binding response OmpR family regulator
MNILMVDDDVVARHVVQGVLTGLGHDVTITVDGNDAWDAWQQERHCVVVADWLMPGPDGLELCRRIRRSALTSYTYFILLTERTGREHRRTALDAGADDFLAKPLDPDELGARLSVAERILGLRGELAQFQALLNMCSYCRRVHDETEVWEPLETYVARHTPAGLSHGVCPDCYARHLEPELRRLVG